MLTDCNAVTLVKAMYIIIIKDLPSVIKCVLLIMLLIQATKDAGQIAGLNAMRVYGSTKLTTRCELKIDQCVFIHNYFDFNAG